MEIINYISKNRFIIAVCFVCWLFLVLVTANKTYTYFASNNLELNYELFIFRAFLVWTIAAAFVPLFIKMASKFPLDSPQKTRNTLVHFAASILFVPLQSVIFRAIMLLKYDPQGQWSEYFNSVIRNSIWIGLISPLIYWLVIGAYHLKKNYNRHRERELRLTRLASELDKARLEVLKKQLQPHFLFNALHNINALIYEDIDAAERMLGQLNKLFDLLFDHIENEEVVLEKELHLISSYLKIEEIRFSDRLKVIMDVEEKTRNAMIPPLILQPMVENALRHGISKKVQGGIVKISISGDEENLIIIIEDNGPGFKATPNNGNRKGVGLTNTRNRLDHLFDHYTFETSLSDLGGAKVVIEIPFKAKSVEYV